MQDGRYSLRLESDESIRHVGPVHAVIKAVAQVERVDGRRLRCLALDEERLKIERGVCEIVVLPGDSSCGLASAVPGDSDWEHMSE